MRWFVRIPINRHVRRNSHEFRYCVMRRSGGPFDARDHRRTYVRRSPGFRNWAVFLWFAILLGRSIPCVSITLVRNAAVRNSLMCVMLVVMIAWAAATGTGWHSQIESRADEQDSAPVEEGFVPLFDGKTLSGWEGDAKLWKAEDGMIVGDSPGIKQNEFLATKKSYGDFELRLEFRLHKGEGNSGVQFRSRRVEGSSEVSGYQADIGEKYWGCLYDESRRNKILVQAPAKTDKALRRDGWNRYVIRAQREHVVLLLNDIETVDYHEADDAIRRDGIIALQVHAGGPLHVEFRNLRIREKPEK